VALDWDIKLSMTRVFGIEPLDFKVCLLEGNFKIYGGLQEN